MSKDDIKFQEDYKYGFKDKDVAEGKKIIEQFNNMIHEESFDEDLLEEAIVFINTSKQAARIRCATIGWNAADEILKDK